MADVFNAHPTRLIQRNDPICPRTQRERRFSYNLRFESFQIRFLRIYKRPSVKIQFLPGSGDDSFLFFPLLHAKATREEGKKKSATRWSRPVCETLFPTFSLFRISFFLLFSLFARQRYKRDDRGKKPLCHRDKGRAWSYLAVMNKWTL